MWVGREVCVSGWENIAAGGKKKEEFILFFYTVGAVDSTCLAETWRALACFLAWKLLTLIILFFNSTAFSLNKFLFVVSKRYLSNPPFLSMVRNTAVVTLTSINAESDSEYKFLFCTLGNQLRLVFFLEKGFYNNSKKMSKCHVFFLIFLTSFFFEFYIVTKLNVFTTKETTLSTLKGSSCKCISWLSRQHFFLEIKSKK